jgi:hypothetical protein
MSISANTKRKRNTTTHLLTEPDRGLKARIELAWLKLTCQRRKDPLAVLVSDRGVISGIDYHAREAGRLVGWYDDRVLLADFQADVRHALQG